MVQSIELVQNFFLASSKLLLIIVLDVCYHPLGKVRDVYMAEWLPVRKAAQIRKCSERNIYNLVKKGVLQSKKEGGRLLILMDVPEEGSEIDPKISEIISTLQKQLEEKDSQIEKLQEQLERTNEALAEASHRHDTVVMQMTRLLEYHQQPFWRRWFKRQALPAPGEAVDTTRAEEEAMSGN